VNWQVKYALANIPKQLPSTAEHVRGELIRIVTNDRPEVLAAISAAEEIGASTAASYASLYPEMDFLCGYRAGCVWDGDAISYLESRNVGWGNVGTLGSAVLDRNANKASHKTWRFSDRLLRQDRRVAKIDREFDRIYSVTLESGKSLRIGMIDDYEPTADSVRTLWDRFGPVDVAWNINPNGNPSPEAIDAGNELGCEVLKWDGLKNLLTNS
jgi:hypothetical protein